MNGRLPEIEALVFWHSAKSRVAQLGYGVEIQCSRTGPSIQVVKCSDHFLLTRFLIFVLLILILLTFQSVIAVNHESPSQETKSVAASAPAFALKDIRGRTARLSDYKGKVLLINFWATWCPPCRAEMPELVKLQKQYQSGGLQIIGITLPPYQRSSVRAMSRHLRVNYPLLFGRPSVSAAYDVGEVMPTTIVVDRKGRIRDRILGILEPEEFDQKVKPLL